jgi:hypothetical protein
MRYCPPVPFRADLVYCYPEIHLTSTDTWGLVFLILVAVVSVGLYLVGKAK